VLAIQVAQVDDMSGGRVEFGLGTGWFKAEHVAYGIPFPAQRFGLLEEQLAVITGLWNTPVGDRFTFTGRHYTLVDSPALPKPTQQPIPIIVGGNGPWRTPALAARYATEYNTSFPPKADIPQRFAAVRQACERVGRDPDELVYSAALVLVCGRGEAEFARRAAAIRREPSELRASGLAGTPQEIVDGIGALEAFGASRVYLQILDLSDIEHVELVAADIAPHVAD
jgi:alkanesulfonate monooxygenase SsuD/methylene tetrahydromethanopterin reductase-like flavin-dependent oxidoreductase (luciferase family)